jgi:hypothetical protein
MLIQWRALTAVGYRSLWVVVPTLAPVGSLGQKST